MKYITEPKTAKNLGFTLLEIIITIGIISLLSTLVLVSFYSLRQSVNLNTTGEDIISALRLARSKTLASEGSSGYGVHLESSKYVLFRGTSYSSSASDNTTYSLSPGVEIYNDSLVGWPDVVFIRISGIVDSSKIGRFGVRLTSNPSQNLFIGVKSSGETSIESPVISLSGTRVADSRHIHFDYSRTIITNTEALTLIFSDPPNADTAENILMVNYTSAGKFDWSGEVLVGGENQVLRIHTHILNDASAGTVFSVHRDRRYNTKALAITLSGDLTGGPAGELINYSASGNEARGSSIYVGDPIRQ